MEAELKESWWLLQAEIRSKDHGTLVVGSEWVTYIDLKYSEQRKLRQRNYANIEKHNILTFVYVQWVNVSTKVIYVIEGEEKQQYKKDVLNNHVWDKYERSKTS